ncbi:conserved exported hypothetical protein [Cupriavidus taiwanensis]|uniref:DUF3304 domain-containing protein n=2 Tax=Cupriavidus taiwanensis TaxID=164546 RepID=A0A976B353_9BURK|nr:DUF3304 domain-containing protein [Cupriavidus taiwanensis]SOZ68991.1 conserved exported hypothetical protein [Cupriavidus taiwanensis]SOZ70131.1 conserved exported hypothetical protein [Cupriavidus taiwanensis]SOZ72998.1 conserved exported hypothetical protein [Cupriavidus taiwanensis]SPA09900.1 conserved exported hypothetical protein [Cupriavidus taiwanensis]
MMMTRMIRGSFVVLLAAMLFGIAACGKAEPPPAAIEDDTLGGQIGVLNYTDVPIGVVYVNGQWAGGMVANAGGTKWIGGISVPKHWDPNFKVTIKWSDDELFEKDEKALYSKEVPVEKYSTVDAAYFYVAFFPNQEVKLYLTRWLPGAENDPAKLEDPTDACLKRKASTERETCYAPEFREEYRMLQRKGRD